MFGIAREKRDLQLLTSSLCDLFRRARAQLNVWVKRYSKPSSGLQERQQVDDRQAELRCLRSGLKQVTEE